MTTAETFANVLYDIMAHKHVLERLRQEQDELIQKYGKDSFINEESVNELKYMEACTSESLRRGNRNVISFRKVMSNISFDGYTVPKGTLVSPSAYHVHYSDELYPHPNEYNPENFYNKTINPIHFLPFGGGKHKYVFPKNDEILF